MFETVDRYIEGFYESLARHPKQALSFVIVILLVWFIGIALNWKWTYERGSFWANISQYLFPESFYRIIVGAIVGLALVVCAALLILC